MQVELVIIAFFDRSKSLQLSNKIVSIRRGSQRLQRSDGGGTRGVINNFDCSRRSVIITVTVQMTSTTLVVRKYVEDTHNITCLLYESSAMRN